MPTYKYHCHACGARFERMVTIDVRHGQYCGNCMSPATMVLSVPHLRAVDADAPDRFTAEMLGIPLKDLPPGLKTTATDKP